MTTEDATIEEVEYTLPTDPSMINPPMKDFFDNPFRNTLDICFWCPLVRLQLMMDNLLSGSFLSNYVSKYNDKRMKQHMEETKRKQIQNSVRSYGNAFQRFNSLNKPTCFDKNENGDYIRDSINCKTNRNIQQK
jgi:hypothetical protein